MPNNAGETKKKRTFKVKKPKEKLFKVTLNLSFTKEYEDPDDLEKGEDDYESNEEFCKRFQEYKKTEELYGTNDKIEKHVKEMDAREFVEYMPPGDVLSAKWLDGFRIQFVFKPEEPNMDIEEVKELLQTFSLEDGEYESSGDNGWTIKTVNGNYEYGLTDYRDSPILVEEVSSYVLSGGKRRNRRQTRRRR